jgi:hypothetical protein
VSGLKRLAVTVALVGALAAGAAAANLALLRSTQDSYGPAGHLSPRAVFSTTQPGGSTVPGDTTSPDGGGHGRDDGGGPDD